MKQALLAVALVLIGTVGGTAITAHAGKPAPAPARPAPAAEPETLEYKFMVLGSADAPTAEHEKQLNAMGAQGWRIVAPIYSGGILNSYLMTRVRAPAVAGDHGG